MISFLTSLLIFSAVRLVAAKPGGLAHDPMETPPTAQPESKVCFCLVFFKSFISLIRTYSAPRSWPKKPKKSPSKIKELFLPTSTHSASSLAASPSPPLSPSSSSQSVADDNSSTTTTTTTTSALPTQSLPSTQASAPAGVQSERSAAKSEPPEAASRAKGATVSGTNSSNPFLLDFGDCLPLRASFC